MVIALGCDHAAFQEKNKVKNILISLGYEVLDFGTNSEESVDYPMYGHEVGKAICNGEADKGIVICGSGIGISIAANKIKGIRAALCTSVKHAELSRKHNDSNILALGARLTDFNDIESILNVWLETSFEGGRHQKRVEKIENYE